VFLAVDEFLPIVLAQRHAPQEAGSPVVPVGDTLVVLQQYRQIDVSGLQRVTDRIPVLHEVHELLHLLAAIQASSSAISSPPQIWGIRPTSRRSWRGYPETA
jgi:hypothetical protein